MNAITDECQEFIVAPGVLGVSKSMKKIGKRIKIAAADTITYDTILIIGESGAGKDVVANAIYEEFKLKKGESDEIPFVHVNIAAIPSELLESELFGHVRGSFTGANKDRLGLIKSANKGILFLDEIGDLPLPLQVKLLHFIQYRTVRAVGADNDKKVEVKLILGTHHDLLKQIEQDKFRHDLFYRIAKIIIAIPPLRDRKDDIPIFIKNHLLKTNGGLKLNKTAMALLEHYPWPGNVRQLLSVIDNSILLMEERLMNDGGEKEILKIDIDTSIFDGNGYGLSNHFIINPDLETVVIQAIKGGMTFANYKILYQRLLLKKVPGTIVDKVKLSRAGRASIYRWEEELGIKSIMYPDGEEKLEKKN